MLVIVNGERRENAAQTVDALLTNSNTRARTVAVAVNYDVVPRAAGPRRRSRRRRDRNPHAAAGRVSMTMS